MTMPPSEGPPGSKRGAFGQSSLGGLDDIPFVAFDTETTGLRETDRLVELAAVRFRGDWIEADWSALVDPGVPIPPAATAVHGIGDADVSGCPRATDVLPSFLAFIEGAALVAHNAPFDVRVLALELLRAGMNLPDNPVVDTCAIPRRLEVGVPNHKLATLAQAFGIPTGRAHRALADARVAMDLLRAYLSALGSPAEALVRRSLAQENALLSFRRFAAEPVPESPLVTLIRRAQAEGRDLFLLSRDGGKLTRVAPRDLYSLGGVVYLEADAADDEQPRTFRTDQIAAARLD